MAARGRGGVAAALQANTSSRGSIVIQNETRLTEPATWLTYAEASVYTGWSVGHLRNLVSAGQIPVYGRPRVRRFRRDMLDLYLTNPDMAMRAFLAERKQPHGR